MEVIQLIPNLLKLLYGLLKDHRVHSKNKLLLIAVAAYVIMPFDLIPDFIPFLGEVDDIYLVAIALLRLLHDTDPEVLRKHWAGSGDIVHLVDRISHLAVMFLPRRVQEILMGFGHTR